MSVLEIIGMVVALGVGIYIGLGSPGLPGPQDRVLPHGRMRHHMRRRGYMPLDWLRPPRR